MYEYLKHEIFDACAENVYKCGLKLPVGDILYFSIRMSLNKHKVSLYAYMAEIH